MKTRYMRVLLGILLSIVSFAPVKGNVTNVDFAPAHWIWYPSGRVLQNTFVLFRKEFNLEKQPKQAIGWILADSRYQLFVNGHRVQWGPAPHDPRWPEADPVDVTSLLKEGKNVIACQVLFYGMGEGTWAMGKPGLIMNLDVDGEKIVTDNTWKSFLADSWKPGQYKRSFLRTLQECFDANNFPYGWDTADFQENADWIPASESQASAAKPSICAGFAEYQWEIYGNQSTTDIRQRSIPMMKENNVSVDKLVETAWVTWKRPCEEYFDMLVPNAYEAEWADLAHKKSNDAWEVKDSLGKAAILTFDFKEQSVGWPYFTIDAPEGTIVELLVHEAHQPGGPVLLNSHFNAWSRFVCKEGINHFETFDFESLRWLQLHIRNNSRSVTVSNVGMRRRQYNFPVVPQIHMKDGKLQRLMDAAVNTLYNSAQETVVDGMARERQQYSGDGSHQLHALYQAFGESRLPKRFIHTFSQGMTLDGYFLDCWPAFDRLARIIERQMQLTDWGPILDHGVGFCFENYHYYQYTGDLDGLKESYPRLLRFFDYLKELRGNDKLLPVENIGIPSVWIDHQAFRQQKHKQCAFNLYVSAMCTRALLPLCNAFGDVNKSREVKEFGDSLLKETVAAFWSSDQKAFVDNLPWVSEDQGQTYYSDRTLALAILFDMCPNDDDTACVRLLADKNKIGVSYPCNAIWAMWALAKANRMDVILKDMRELWATMPSVTINNTIQEFWQTEPDSWSQWSHCAVGPLIILYQGIAGIRPLKPGYEECMISPQLGDLTDVELEVQTPAGGIHFKTEGKYGKRTLLLDIPAGIKAVLNLDSRENVKLKPLISNDSVKGKKQYELIGGKTYKLNLKYM